MGSFVVCIFCDPGIGHLLFEKGFYYLKRRIKGAKNWYECFMNSAACTFHNRNILYIVHFTARTQNVPVPSTFFHGLADFLVCCGGTLRIQNLECITGPGPNA